MYKPPKKGLSLGWSLTVSTALVLTIVMGGLTYYQKKISLRNQRADRVELLKESLTPLAAQLEKAGSLQELREISQQFHLAYDSSKHAGHEVIIRDTPGKIIYQSSDGAIVNSEDEYLEATIPISLEKSGLGKMRLTVLKDNTTYRRFVRDQWLFWGIHILITIVTLFIFLLPVVYLVISRPVRLLLNAVVKMESGYWSGVTLSTGAWELRWLAWRFSNMVKEVQSTMTQLYCAERKALQLLHEHEQEPYLNPEGAYQLPPRVNLQKLEETVDMLKGVCVQLENSSVEDPASAEMARQATKVHALAAGRLNLWDSKVRIENAALKILEPDVFAQLDSELLHLKKRLGQTLDKNKVILKKRLQSKGIPYVMISSRVKHTAGVWNKMKMKNLAIEEVNDLFALRIVVPTETDCYTTLALVHELFRPLVSRFKDYIATPKSNGYQSLHTSVKGVHDLVFEVQIRSISMHKHAEQGDAAHWQYKEIMSAGTAGL